MIRIGVDLGGTNISVGAVDGNYRIVSMRSCKTKAPRPGIDICNDIADIVRSVLRNIDMTLNDVPYIGIGCPGTVNKETGIVEFSSNLFLHNWEIIKEMQKILKKRVVIENDANAAAYGECLAGAAKGKRNAVAITIGTGIGSGIITNGKIYSGSNYAGAEIGHMVIVYNGRECTCSRRGCFETYASATGLVRTTKEYMDKCNKKDTILWSMIDYDVDKINGRSAFEAAKKNDRVGKLIIDAYISHLACGLTNVVNIFQPDVMCLGGGLCNERDDLLLEPLKKIIESERYSRYSKKQTDIVKAKLGNDAGIIGASML